MVLYFDNSKTGKIMRITLLNLWMFLLLLNACQAQDKMKHTNALINETSPYLLQHAYNPVDWNPWDEAVLAKAQTEKKLLVISVGYAACHWCHVMEEESFEDTTVANLMNQHFVSIKVDREERPDIDAIYMGACQLASGEACGWPLNVFALPDGRPVWAGTYFPKKQWLEILEYFVKIYEESPEKLEEYAARLTEGIQELDAVTQADESLLQLDLANLEETINVFKSSWDAQKGGRMGAPKFPSPNTQELLLQWAYYQEDTTALALLETTLVKMAQGGIYDQIGGGFARYSTDEDWKVPHFEKMLYDNGQLVSLYAKAYALTGKTYYKQIAAASLDFVERALMDATGGFYSSLDADSEGEEGKFYIWDKQELNKLIRDDKLREYFFEFYQIQSNGNWENDQNILYHTQSLSSFAQQKGLDEVALAADFEEIKTILLNQRNQRVRPGLDDKVLTSWNALMLQGYIDAYRYFDEEKYLNLALKNANFIATNLLESNGRLDRTYKDGQTKINAFLDDYALLSQAYISLYEVTFDAQWLSKAKLMTDYVIDHFYNKDKGIFNYTSDLDPQLIARKVELTDNVIPGSNSSIAKVLYQLSLLFYDASYQEIARTMVANMYDDLVEPGQVGYYPNWIQLYISMSNQPYEVAIVGPEYASLQKEFQQKYLPNALFLGGVEEGDLALLKNKLQEGATMIYVCKDKFCKLPVQEVAAAVEQMK
ncbi:MAG: thioredoxin domain-containing protein [Saprospiraceae bacterium]